MNIWYNETFRILNSQADYSIQDLELYLNSANGKIILLCLYLLIILYNNMFLLLYTTTTIYQYIHIYSFLHYYNHYIYEKYKN